MTESGRKGIVSFIGPALYAVVVTCCLALAGAAQAVTISGLYSVDVPVEGSGGDLDAGYAEGLRQVMVRVSGSREVLELEGVDEILANAETMLQSYEVTRDGGQSRLQMTFGAVGVNSALASIDAPVWGANRPLTLAWIAVEDRGDRVLLSSPADSDNAARWRGSLMSASAERGLPVALPPKSFVGDRGVLSDLWGQFTDRIRQASEDQPRDALALVRIRRNGEEWQANWRLGDTAVDDREGSVTAGSRSALMKALINEWAEGFASRYSVAAGDVGDLPRVDIVLEGVSSLSDYGNVSKVLGSFTPVNAVGATRVRGERLTMQVSFNGELEQFKQYVALDPRFVALEQPSEPETPPAGNDDRDASGDPEAGSDGVSEQAAGEEAETGASGANNPLGYQPLSVGDDEDAEQAFESLYQVLYYRWQPASMIGSGSDG